MSSKKKFERLADKLLDMAVSMGQEKNLKEESPMNPARQIRQNAILILDHVLKVLKSILG
jgi:hypothetical protein